MGLYEKYEKLDDEKVVEIIHNGDEIAQEYILEKYKKFVKAKSRLYYIAGGDKEDIVQEGMIGLHKAMRDYDKSKNASFHSFAELCVTRQIVSAIRSAGRQKHIPLNSSLSLNRTVGEDSDESYLEIIPADENSNPENLIIDREEVYDIGKSIVNNLSSLENRVLILYLNGKSYQDISNIVKKDEKAIDNALQRVKKKIIKIIEERKE